MKQISKVISIIFHPVFMPLVGMFILLNAGIFETNIPVEFKQHIYMFVGIFSIVLPLSFLPLLYYWRIIKSVEMNETTATIEASELLELPDSSAHGWGC